MAVDESILDSVRRGESLSSLRFYSWDPPCLSLGYAQPVGDVDLTAISQRGWNLVRRPTGGRAILHTDELTYSVIGSPQDPRLSGSVLESYRCLSQAILQALHSLNIPALALEKPTNSTNITPNPRSTNPVCFEVPSNYEITVNGKKLVGSAQARRRDGVLQHGSFPLFGDLTRILEVIPYSDQAERSEAGYRLLERACTAETVLGHPFSWEQAAAAFRKAFEDTLNIQFEISALTDSELSFAEELIQSKYANSRWTDRI
jgi:lipoate-protein ligase A